LGVTAFPALLRDICMYPNFDYLCPPVGRVPLLPQETTRFAAGIRA